MSTLSVARRYAAALFDVARKSGAEERVGQQLKAFADLVARLNELAAKTRARGGRVVFIQHDGPEGDEFHPDAPGWPLELVTCTPGL